MRDRDDSRRQGYRPRSDESGESGEPDQWRYREDQDEWRHGSRWMHGSDRGWDRGGGGWRPEGRGGMPSEREASGYEPRGREASGYEPRGEGYQGGYNMGMNYGQGGPQGQGFGPGAGGYRGQGYGGRAEDDRGEWGGGGEYGGAGGPGTGGHSGASYGGFGGHGYARGEGSWRQGRWEPGPGQEHPYGRSDRQSPPHDDRGQNLQRGFGMSPHGGYGSREEGAYGGDEERGTWGGSGYQGSGHGGDPGGRQARPPRGYQRSDERIREDICDTVIRMSIDAGEVDIEVEHCEVTLTGTVANRQDKRRLEDLAESVSGVKHVHNQLRVGEQQRDEWQATSGETQDQSGGHRGTSTSAGRHATHPTHH